MSFLELGLSEPLLRALSQEGYTEPTPIQLRTIPAALAGRDILGIAQTGTGKTAAFGLPLLHRLAATPGRPPRGGCRALILSPTRELASQIADSLKAYGRHLGLSIGVVFGGVPHGAQRRLLGAGVDVLVATPGRLQDHIDAGDARMDHVQIFVLDEADQMLDKGFWPAVRRLLPRLPKERQTMFFSATMPTEVSKLSGEILRNPERVEVTPVGTRAERVDQSVILIEQDRKRTLLAVLLQQPGVERALVFTRTKHGADKVVRNLELAGIPAVAIHGNKSQGQRERALDAFKRGTAPVLVATDIAARGIDVEAVTHVIQHDMPDTAEAYVHRIGRTARAGASGIAIALCSNDERDQLKDVQKLIRQEIPTKDMRNSIDAPKERAAPAPGRVRPHGQAQRGRPPQRQQQQRRASGGGR